LLEIPMNDALISTSALSKQFPVKSGPFGKNLHLQAVDSVDLRISTGETLGLAGESGCGKSTVGKLLMGLIPPSAGNISFRGRLLQEMSKKELAAFRRDVQMIFQDPFSSLNPRMRVGEIIGEPFAVHGVASGAQRQAQVLNLMTKVGLSEEHFYRYVAARSIWQ
jgi:peptide/nickel transport system ATP-binding protein